MTVYVDTSFYVALLGPQDRHHADAIRFATSFRGHLVTTEYVLLELANRLCKSRDKATFVRAAKGLKTDPRTFILPSDPALFGRGVDLFANRLDKDWSLTDCISIVVMREQGISDVLSTDHHFEQAGFTVLLK